MRGDTDNDDLCASNTTPRATPTVLYWARTRSTSSTVCHPIIIARRASFRPGDDNDGDELLLLLLLLLVPLPTASVNKTRTAR